MGIHYGVTFLLFFLLEIGRIFQHSTDIGDALADHMKLQSSSGQLMSSPVLSLSRPRMLMKFFHICFFTHAAVCLLHFPPTAYKNITDDLLAFDIFGLNSQSWSLCLKEDLGTIYA